MDAEGWMDSGDLGYWADGEIFITGRLKDLIIKGGRNVVPQEVEAAASEAAGVRRGCIAAFGAEDPATGTERMVVVAETRATSREELDRIEQEILRAVETAVGIPPDVVRLVSPQSIPKTSSGKIRRQETKVLFLSGRLEARRRPPWLQLARLAFGNLGSWASRGLRSAGRALRRWWEEALLLVTCLLARLLPLGWVARPYLWLSGHQTDARGAVRGPAVLVANRAGRLDPLVVASAVRPPLRFADPGALAGLPPLVRDLLRPLVAAPIYGPRAKHAIRRVLEKGGLVVVFPESAIGEPAWRSRFRLDAFHAAADTQTPVYPVAVSGPRKRVRIVIGHPVLPSGGDPREMVRLRDAVRTRLAEL
jgi:1-acyl-sn-glycerol-3-phosphate acyltransferase